MVEMGATRAMQLWYPRHTDEEMDAINIKRAKFHGEWNYTIRPNNRLDRAADS